MNIQVSSIQKKTALESAKAQVVGDLYRTLLTNGIDPDELDPSDPEANSDFLALSDSSDPKNGSKAYDVQKIRELCDAYVKIQSKLESIA